MKQFRTSAAGNTFIGAWLEEGEQVPTSEKIAEVCAQHGTDGFFAVSPSHGDSDISVVYFNRDGSKDGVCGNALACAAGLGKELGVGDSYSIEACGKIHRAFVDSKGVSVTFPDASKEPVLIDNHYHIDVGVPHVVVPMPYPPTSGDVSSFGHNYIRNWPGSEMINVSMFSMDGDFMHVASYEYGVWRVTGSCGTGILAAFNVARHLGKIGTDTTAIVPSGAEVEVYSEWDALTFKTSV